MFGSAVTGMRTATPRAASRSTFVLRWAQPAVLYRFGRLLTDGGADVVNGGFIGRVATDHRFVRRGGGSDDTLEPAVKLRGSTAGGKQLLARFAWGSTSTRRSRLVTPRLQAAVITSTASSHAGSAVCRRAFWPRRTRTSYQSGREAAVDRRRPSRRRSGCRGSPALSYFLRKKS